MYARYWVYSMYLALYLLVWRLTKHWVYLLKVPFDNYVWPRESADIISIQYWIYTHLLSSPSRKGRSIYRNRNLKCNVGCIDCVFIITSREKRLSSKHLLINSLVKSRGKAVWCSKRGEYSAGFFLNIFQHRIQW